MVSSPLTPFTVGCVETYRVRIFKEASKKTTYFKVSSANL